MRRFLACFVAAALLALTASACGSTLTDAATIRYSLSGESQEDHITRADLIDEVEKLVENEPFHTWLKENGYEVSSDDAVGSVIASTWLSQLIRQRAIDALFASRDLEITPQIREQATEAMGGAVFPSPEIFAAFDREYREELIDREARRQAVVGSFADLSDEAGREYFENHKAEFVCVSGKDVAHILVPTRAEAQAILDELRNGGDFAQLAQENSTDTGSASAGGELGCLAPDLFVPTFQQAAELAPNNEPVGPVKTQFGYHVILVTPAVVTYEAARSQVQDALAQEGQAAALAEVNKLMKTFRVHVDPRFGEWTQDDGQGQTFLVTPPSVPKPSTQREGTTTTTEVLLPEGTP
jgi:parvulin-like peptidyl-prolyl isomerase